MIRNRSPT